MSDGGITRGICNNVTISSTTTTKLVIVTVLIVLLLILIVIPLIGMDFKHMFEYSTAKC